MASTYDFIIVGGGTAGCLLAHRLSHSLARPSVLLVEAGSKPEGDYLRAPFFRYAVPAMRPDLDHAYESLPMKACNNRTIPYTRGKGLGGSSICNFAVYLYGSSEDYNRWADLVGDESWRWEHTKKSFQAIENFDFEGATKGYKHLADPDPDMHGTKGTVKVSLPPALEKGIAPIIEALMSNGDEINLDLNSGNPIGLGIFPSSYAKDGRITSAIAHLVDLPNNLEVWTGATVSKLEFEGTRVVGVQAADGRKAMSKETIICGGAIDTPRLLLLNGIGPAKELEALGIEVKKDLPGVGKQLHDHVMTFLCAEVDASQNDRYAFENNEKLVAEAQAQWEKDQSGTFALHHSSICGGFLKLPELQNYPEYQALDKGTQEFLAREAVPTYEFISSCLLWPPDTKLPEGSGYMTAIAFLMNPQSEGSITLRSSDPQDKPAIELGFLEHPYDRRILREGIRKTWTKVFENPEIKTYVKGQIYGPKSLSDEDIDAFMKEGATTVWHMNGTAAMGRPDDALACVGKDFRVYGMEGLRVADLSVCPLTTNNHTQATAYLVGQKAADSLTAEYRLDRAGESKL